MSIKTERVASIIKKNAELEQETVEELMNLKAEEIEKKKYMPWQGGTYGGSLTFEHNGKEYRITRTFSTKKNEDTFELLDLKTNKPSTDYTSDLGTELFGIGKDTYARSVHVTLDQTPAGSNDISARLNNLVEADDISNFDNAISVLTTICRKFSKIGFGKIATLRSSKLPEYT